MAEHLFEVCHVLLERGASPPPTSDRALLAKAHRFLLALDYLDENGDATDAAAQENRAALLHLAARMDRVFSLPMRQSPGARLYGGQVSPARFGLTADGPAVLNPAGRGLTARAAFESCIGEAVEHLAFLEWPEDEARQRLDAVAAPGDAIRRGEADWFAADLGIAPDALGGLEWIEARALVDGARRAVPLELCLRRPAALRHGRRRAESNGCGAGPDLAAARTGGLLEVIERDATALWWYGGAEAERISEDRLDDGGATRLAERVRPAASRPHWFLDLTTEFAVAIVACLSAERDGSTVVGGFAAGLDMTTALHGAFLEMCQMEVAQELMRRAIHNRGIDELNATERRWHDHWRHLSLDNHPRLQPPYGSTNRHEAVSSVDLAACRT